MKARGRGRRGITKPDGTKIEYEPENFVEGRCPCGGMFAAGSHKNGDGGSVQHTVPSCQDFLEKSPEDYLAWLRKSLALN